MSAFYLTVDRPQLPTSDWADPRGMPRPIPTRPYDQDDE